jgi:hypothetical protein
MKKTEAEQRRDALLFASDAAAGTSRGSQTTTQGS